MNIELEILYARRPEVNYVSPPVCEGDVSSTGGPVIVLEPFPGIAKLTNVIVYGGGSGSFKLHWDTTPGDICYNVYEVVGDELVLVIECSPNDPELPGPGSYVVTPVTPDGEGPPSDPVSTDEPSPPPPPPPPAGDEDCPAESGTDTSCDLTGPFAAKWRIKDFQPSWFDVSACGMTVDDCKNCRTFGPPDIDCTTAVEWTGTFPVKDLDYPFIQGWIDQEFEYSPFDPGFPPPPHTLSGLCIDCSLRSGSVSNSTGCGWIIRINGYYNGSFIPLVWLGIKKVGEGPAGRYYKAAGCSPGPECLEIESY